MIEQIRLTDDETEKIKKMHSETNKFPMPDFSSPLYVIQRPIYDESMNLLGSYLLHLTSEVSLILDKDLGTLEKARIVKDIVPEINKDCKLFGIDDTHVFVNNDPKFAEFLVNHAGFKIATGTALYRKVTDE